MYQSWSRSLWNMTDWFSELDELSDDFPEEFFKMKVLPELLKSVEFGGGGPKVLGAIIKIGTKLTADEYSAKLTPVIVRLFANPDRAIRVCLLDNLPLMIDNIPQRIVNDKIFPQMVSLSGLISTCCTDACRRLDSRMLHPPLENRLSRLYWQSLGSSQTARSMATC